MARPINPNNRITGRVVASGFVKTAAAHSPHALSPPPIPLPVIGAPVAAPVYPMVAGEQMTARERRRYMRLYAPVSQSAPDTTRITFDDLPAVGIAQSKSTVLRMIKQGRFPPADERVGGKKRKRSYWLLGTLRRFLAGEQSPSQLKS